MQPEEHTKQRKLTESWAAWKQISREHITISTPKVIRRIHGQKPHTI
jgi:hypothetical protein